MAEGSGLRERTFDAERRIAWVRAVLIAFNIASYVWLMPKEGTIVPLAITVIVVAGLYGPIVAFWQPYRRFDVMQSAAWTTVTDAVLIVAWLTATGGAESPYLLLWGVSLVAISYRYGPRETWAATGVYVALDAIILVTGGAFAPASTAFWARLAYWVFIGAIAGFASRYTQIGIERQGRLQDLVDEVDSARAELAQERNRLRSIVESAPSIIMEVDREGHLQYINQLRDGHRMEDVIGVPATAFLEPDSVAPFTHALNAVLARRRVQVVNVRGAGDGDDVADYVTHIGPLFDGEGAVRGATLISLDVTEQRRQEERSRELDRLKEEEAFRTAFINAAAHEINTPLTPLRLQLGRLRRAVLAEGGSERAITIMERNLARLGTLATDLLDATRMQAGKIRWSKDDVEMREALDEVVQSFAELAVERGIQLEASVPDEPLWAECDPLRLSQILYNLVSNALKFTPSGGRVQCDLERQDGHVVVAVSDTGPGLTEDEKARLFHPFVQVHSSNAKEEPGTGLGLYISRNLAQVQGGQLDVESAGHGHGATFTLRLPVAQTV